MAAGASHGQLLQLVDDVIPETACHLPTSFFFIVNTNQELRFHMDVPHVAPSRNVVMMTEAINVATRQSAAQFSVQRFQDPRLMFHW